MIKTPIRLEPIDRFESVWLDAEDQMLEEEGIAEYINAVTAELTALREFVASLRSMAWEQKDGELYAHGKYLYGKFTIFDINGNGVASGDNALTAWEEFRKNG